MLPPVALVPLRRSHQADCWFRKVPKRSATSTRLRRDMTRRQSRQYRIDSGSVSRRGRASGINRRVVACSAVIFRIGQDKISSRFADISQRNPLGEAYRGFVAFGGLESPFLPQGRPSKIRGGALTETNGKRVQEVIVAPHDRMVLDGCC